MCRAADVKFRISRPIYFFFCLTPPPYSQFRDPGVRPAPRGAIRLRGKEVVFFEAEWPGFEPRTSNIRRGRYIHSATPHLACTILFDSFFCVTSSGTFVDCTYVLCTQIAWIAVNIMGMSKMSFAWCWKLLRWCCLCRGTFQWAKGRHDGHSSREGQRCLGLSGSSVTSPKHEI